MNYRNLNLYSMISGVALLMMGFLAWVGQDQFDGMSLWGYAALCLGVLAMAFGLWESRQDLRGGIQRRSTRVGFQVASMVAIVLGILVVVEMVSVKHNVRWDMTPGKFFSLSQKTINILEKLDKEKKSIEILSFTRKSQTPQIKEILGQYPRHSKMIRLRFIDLDASPRTAKKYEVDGYGTIVVVHHFGKVKGIGKSAPTGSPKFNPKNKSKTFRSEKFFDLSENSIANAILKTIQTDQKVVYFLTGHGERLHIGTGRAVMATLAGGMRSDNYKVEELFLLRRKGVPKKTNLLIVAAPKKDIEKAEAGFLEAYLNRGGRMLVLLEPDSPQGRLTDLLKKYGFALPESFVIDPRAVQFSLVGGNELTPFVSQYGIHDITRQMRGLATMFPTARRVSAKNLPKKGINAETLVKTGPGSFTVASLNIQEKKASYDPKTKKDGPVPLGAAVRVDLKKFLPKGAIVDKKKKASVTNKTLQKSPTESRIVVFGDADFASDAFIGSQGNGNLAFNAVNWLSGEKALITIRPKRRVGDPLILSSGQSAFVHFFTVWLMPLFVILAGTAVYVRRRQLR